MFATVPAFRPGFQLERAGAMVSRAMQALVVVHVFANMVWIGAIVAVGLLVGAAGYAKDEARAELVGALAHSLYRLLAAPAFVISFAAGAVRLASDVGTYMSLHWMHGKLAGALVVIALHHVLGARAKRAANGTANGTGRTSGTTGSRQASKSNAILTGATLAFAFVTVTFAILKGQLVP
jgi:protoporphyrinogen IX oxidase